MRASISDNPATGTDLAQDDPATLSFLQSIDRDLLEVFWNAENRHEERFGAWLERLDQRDIDRLARIAAVTREIEKDKARAERETLIARRHGKGFR